MMEEALSQILETLSSEKAGTLPPNSLKVINILCSSSNKESRLKGYSCYTRFLEQYSTEELKNTKLCYSIIKPLQTTQHSPFYKDRDCSLRKLEILWSLLVKVQTLMHLEGPQAILEILIQLCVMWAQPDVYEKVDPDLETKSLKVINNILSKGESVLVEDEFYKTFSPLTSPVIISSKFFCRFASSFLKLFQEQKFLENRQILIEIWHKILEYLEQSRKVVDIKIWHQLFTILNQVVNENYITSHLRLEFIFEAATMTKSVLNHSKYIDSNNVMLTPAINMLKTSLMVAKMRPPIDLYQYSLEKIFTQCKLITQTLTMSLLKTYDNIDTLISVVRQLDSVVYPTFLWGLWTGCCISFCDFKQDEALTDDEMLYYRKLRGVSANFDLDEGFLEESCRQTVRETIARLHSLVKIQTVNKPTEISSVEILSAHPAEGNCDNLGGKDEETELKEETLVALTGASVENLLVEPEPSEVECVVEECQAEEINCDQPDIVEEVCEQDHHDVVEVSCGDKTDGEDVCSEVAEDRTDNILVENQEQADEQDVDRTDIACEPNGEIIVCESEEAGVLDQDKPMFDCQDQVKERVVRECEEMEVEQERMTVVDTAEENIEETVQELEQCVPLGGQTNELEWDDKNCTPTKNVEKEDINLTPVSSKSQNSRKTEVKHHLDFDTTPNRNTDARAADCDSVSPKTPRRRRKGPDLSVDMKNIYPTEGRRRIRRSNSFGEDFIMMPLTKNSPSSKKKVEDAKVATVVEEEDLFGDVIDPPVEFMEDLALHNKENEMIESETDHKIHINTFDVSKPKYLVKKDSSSSIQNIDNNIDVKKKLKDKKWKCSLVKVTKGIKKMRKALIKTNKDEVKNDVEDVTDSPASYDYDQCLKNVQCVINQEVEVSPAEEQPLVVQVTEESEVCSAADDSSQDTPRNVEEKSSMEYLSTVSFCENIKQQIAMRDLFLKPTKCVGDNVVQTCTSPADASEDEDVFDDDYECFTKKRKKVSILDSMKKSKKIKMDEDEECQENNTTPCCTTDLEDTSLPAFNTIKLTPVKNKLTLHNSPVKSPSKGMSPVVDKFSRASRMLALITDSQFTLENIPHEVNSVKNVKKTSPGNVKFSKYSRASKMLAMCDSKNEQEDVVVTDVLEEEDVSSGSSTEWKRYEPTNKDPGPSVLKSNNMLTPPRRKNIRFDDDRNETVVYPIESPPIQSVQDYYKRLRSKKMNRLYWKKMKDQPKLED